MPSVFHRIFHICGKTRPCLYRVGESYGMIAFPWGGIKPFFPGERVARGPNLWYK
jgi:hypothetical protein